MSRIQQILAKAERDGTARRVGTLERRRAPRDRRSPSRRRVFEPRLRPSAAPLPVDDRAPTNAPDFSVVRADDDARSDIASVPARTSRDAARQPVQATLSPVLVAALDPALARGGAVPLAAQPHRARRERAAAARDSDHEPGHRATARP